MTLKRNFHTSGAEALSGVRDIVDPLGEPPLQREAAPRVDEHPPPVPLPGDHGQITWLIATPRKAPPRPPKMLAATLAAAKILASCSIRRSVS
jgi:hypothetical protein